MTDKELNNEIHMRDVEAMVSTIGLLIMLGQLATPRTDDKAKIQEHADQVMGSCRQVIVESLKRHGIEVNKGAVQ